ncbi:hypothetical protein B7Y94_02145 [Candidatus Saccharibacteria bacterium 32-49-12]|nr:MAG: hypothetical protein B7Y94_02145 [Candidatus Saccharibacteria bacterium 32-49-12]
MSIGILSIKDVERYDDLVEREDSAKAELKSAEQHMMNVLDNRASSPADRSAAIERHDQAIDSLNHITAEIDHYYNRDAMEACKRSICKHSLDVDLGFECCD